MNGELILALLRDPNVVTGIAAVLLVIALIVGAELWRHVRANERLVKYANAIKYAKDRAEDMFLYIQTQGLDMTAVKIGDKVVDYEALEELSEAKYGYTVDAKMLYVLDDAEQFVFKKFGVKIEFDDIIPRAQSWFVKWYEAYLKAIRADQPVQAVEGHPIMAQLEVKVDPIRSASQKARREQERRRKMAEEGNAPVVAEVPATGELAVIHTGESVLPTAVAATLSNAAIDAHE